MTRGGWAPEYRASTPVIIKVKQMIFAHKGIQVYNNSKIPNATIKEIMDLTIPNGFGKFQLEINESAWRYHGLFHYSFMRGVDKLIISIGSDVDYPYYIKEHGPYQEIGWINNQTEVLMLVVAHEVSHLIQSKKAKHNWDKIHSCQSEKRADEYAKLMLEKWRNIIIYRKIHGEVR